MDYVPVNLILLLMTFKIGSLEESKLNARHNLRKMSFPTTRPQRLFPVYDQFNTSTRIANNNSFGVKKNLVLKAINTVNNKNSNNSSNAVFRSYNYHNITKNTSFQKYSKPLCKSNCSSDDWKPIFKQQRKDVNITSYIMPSTEKSIISFTEPYTGMHVFQRTRSNYGIQSNQSKLLQNYETNSTFGIDPYKDSHIYEIKMNTKYDNHRYNLNNNNNINKFNNKIDHIIRNSNNNNSNNNKTSTIYRLNGNPYYGINEIANTSHNENASSRSQLEIPSINHRRHNGWSDSWSNDHKNYCSKNCHCCTTAHEKTIKYEPTKYSIISPLLNLFGHDFDNWNGRTFNNTWLYYINDMYKQYISRSYDDNDVWYELSSDDDDDDADDNCNDICHCCVVYKKRLKFMRKSAILRNEQERYKRWIYNIINVIQEISSTNDDKRSYNNYNPVQNHWQLYDKYNEHDNVYKPEYGTDHYAPYHEHHDNYFDSYHAHDNSYDSYHGHDVDKPQKFYCSSCCKYCKTKNHVKRTKIKLKKKHKKKLIKIKHYQGLMNRFKDMLQRADHKHHKHNKLWSWFNKYKRFHNNDDDDDDGGGGHNKNNNNQCCSHSSDSSKILIIIVIAFLIIKAFSSIKLLGLIIIPIIFIGFLIFFVFLLGKTLLPLILLPFLLLPLALFLPLLGFLSALLPLLLFPIFFPFIVGGIPGIPQVIPGALPGIPGTRPGIPGTGQGLPGTGQGIPGIPQGIPGIPQGIPGIPQGTPGVSGNTLNFARRNLTLNDSITTDVNDVETTTISFERTTDLATVYIDTTVKFTVTDVSRVLEETSPVAWNSVNREQCLERAGCLLAYRTRGIDYYNTFIYRILDNMSRVIRSTLFTSYKNAYQSGSNFNVSKYDDCVGLYHCKEFESFIKKIYSK